MKRILSLLLTGLTFVAAQAQEAKTCFTNMPDSLCPLLTAVNRADCIDFMESGMKAEVTNRFDGKSEMTRLAPDYIHMRMSGQSTWQMKLLATSDTTRIICTVSTVCASACDSDIRFYTTDWQELPAEAYLPALPVLGDFISDDTGTAGKENAGGAGVDENGSTPKEEADGDNMQALRKADMLLMQADLSADDTTLTFTCTTPAYREKEVADTLSALLGKRVVYRWQAGAFHRE